MKIKFNTLDPIEMETGDMLELELNNKAPKDERPLIEIKIMDKDCVEVMMYKSKGKLLVITEDEVNRMGIETWVEKYTIKDGGKTVTWVK